MPERKRMQLDLTDDELRQLEALQRMFGKTTKTATVKAVIRICSTIMDHTQPSAGGFKELQVISHKDSKEISLIFL
jgi:hypothetical protein